jgi:hypothetical protein
MEGDLHCISVQPSPKIAARKHNQRFGGIRVQFKWIPATISAALLVVGLGCGKQMATPAAAVIPESSSAETAQTIPFAKAKPSPLDANTKSSLVPDQLVIPSGTSITVRLQNGVSSATSNPGDQFEAVLDQAIISQGRTLALEGTRVSGHVINVRRSGRLSHSGYLRIALSSMIFNGKAVPVESSSIMVAGGSHKRRNLGWIGGGAGGGALIGALAGGGTGALIGTAIGGAAGTSTAFATGKKDVGFGPERRLTFRLTHPVTIA